MDGEVILQVDSVKYLGHHLTNDFYDDLDIRRQCRPINVRGNILFRKFHMCSVSMKLKLLNSYCASICILLTCGAWKYNKMSICKLRDSDQIGAFGCQRIHVHVTGDWTQE